MIKDSEYYMHWYCSVCWKRGAREVVVEGEGKRYVCRNPKCEERLGLRGGAA